MRKKGLISLMLAGLVSTTAVAAVGCDDNKPVGDMANLKYTDVMADAYLVVDENGERTMHKGDVCFLIFKEPGQKKGTSDIKIFLDCKNEDLPYTTDTLMLQEKPQEDEYDEICERCFHND